MKIASPLRYPGGKSALFGLISDIRRINNLRSRYIAEPYAGGAGASLKSLFLEETEKIYVNDADQSIFNFWKAITTETDDFVGKIMSTPVTIDEWRNQKSIYKDRNASLVDHGFSTFYLNRTNRSGIIINGGPIGGYNQSGKYKIDARFNKVELSNRCNKIGTYCNRIVVSKNDGIQFIRTHNTEKMFFFIDPPYYEKGNTLYMNVLRNDYHKELAKLLKGMTTAAWVLTYDDCQPIRSLYEEWANVETYTLRYSAATKRSSKEVLITPRWMKTP